MICSRLFLAIGTVIAAALVPLLAFSPVPKDKPPIRLAPGGDMKIDDLRVEDAAVIDENRIVLVGSKSGPEDAHPDTLDVNGVILDLAKKSTQTFTNGHKARIKSVSVGRGRIATVSTKNDPALRIWDFKAGKTIKEIRINKIFANVREVYRDGEPPQEYDAVAWFHKSDRLAIAASEYVILLDPNKPDEPSLLRTPMLTRTDKRENVVVSDWFTKEPLTISPDDAWAACPVGRANIVFWSLKTEEAADVSLVPKGAKDPENWSVDGATFAPSGKLLAWRTNLRFDEVPKGKAEKDVPTERRGVVRIEIRDAPKGKVVPLGIGPEYLHVVLRDRSYRDVARNWRNRPPRSAKAGRQKRRRVASLSPPIREAGLPHPAEGFSPLEVGIVHSERQTNRVRHSRWRRALVGHVRALT